jgi:hypothetical protein
MRRLLALSVIAVAALAAEDPWAKVRELRGRFKKRCSCTNALETPSPSAVTAK